MFFNISRQENRKALGGLQADRYGYFAQPTIFPDVTPDLRIVNEEIFGPIGILVKFKNEEEMIEIASDNLI